MGSNWGKNLKISLFGESHGTGVGVVIDGLPGGLEVDLERVKEMMARRAPGKDPYSTKRKEPDRVEILSGIYKGKTTGTPLAGMIYNKDTRSQDYKDMPLRPSHGDYTGLLRYGGYGDPRGGGHFSARLTAPLVFAGAVAGQLLEQQFGITIGAHIAQIFNVIDDKVDPVTVTKEQLMAVSAKEFPVVNDEKGILMQEEIEKARMDLDSLGGLVECFAHGLPAGVGSPIFDGLENQLASILFGIPGVRGMEFGTGFAAAALKGSQHNDPFRVVDGKIITTTNHHGGILGGISSGMPLVVRVALKPTASISRPQESVDYGTKTETMLEITGRHDPCIVPRGVPVVEAAVATALLDSLLEGGNPNVTW